MIKFIDKSKLSDCWVCKGTGKIIKDKCKTCNGTGKWKEEFYHLIYKDKNGQQIAFGIDGLK